MIKLNIKNCLNCPLVKQRESLEPNWKAKDPCTAPRIIVTNVTCTERNVTLFKPYGIPNWCRLKGGKNERLYY